MIPLHPNKRASLIKHAEEKGADEKVLRALKQLPDEQYETPVYVSKAIGESE